MTKRVKKVVSLLSGGLDSLVLIDFLLQNNFEVFCLFVDYGQISAKFEYEAFLKICKFKNIKWYQKIDISNFGEYVNSSLTKTNFQDSFFPSRNLLLLTLASSLLENLNCDYIAIGVIQTSNDYPDCIRSYFDDLEALLTISIKNQVKILTPLDNFTKNNIIEYSNKYHLPIEKSYSCEKGKENHCQQCPSCVERFDAINWFNNRNDM